MVTLCPQFGRRMRWRRRSQEGGVLPGNSGRKFNAVDGYVHERLAIFAGRKHGLAGRNWTTRYTYGWITRLLGVYRPTGNVRGAPAHAQR
jgi:RNA-directed DNA polymerase